ncbi:unnamed protein product [Penicillium nalgiovense]|uniref:Uncharacterized protein n=1 Tax=Penicillium nalgiovense TaxID=60175 RepID=A0A9W4HYW3_PENNA|nr:unnamed protein product [Penicillium nalgiovense]CAG7990422.1 unnamed protein product [Penicillium nalgiovense]CAG8029386.1 unnamed protein product [Penicillium nalgiovense]CAG8048572.1 unnamed protein product [Penicillium nalgiovense]CAG8071381.1 unnamed protein product [Penicillium nalgiovense]
MEQLAQLMREVERIVTAPYVPSLQDLHDLVHQNQSLTIGAWAFCKPCQVGLLADVLIEALSRSRVALPLITAFASTSTFRDALLERHPVILDVFLEKAMDSNRAEYLPACTALFSSPLPAGVVPPARIAPFITKLVSMTAGNPCVETVAPLHALFSGLKGSPRVLNDIPSEVMSNLQLEFTKTLRNLDDHMGNLLCLATFAQIATALGTTSQNQHGSEAPWLLNIKHFFGQKRGLKTLDLVVLRVILACSSSCKLAPSEAAESIRLAICIAEAIESEQKQVWIAGNNSKIAKLCEKAVRDGLHGQTQTMVIVFLHTLLPVHSLPSQLRELGIKVLLSKNSQETLEKIPHQLIPRLAKSLAESGALATRQLLTFIFDVLRNSKWSGMGEMATLHLAHLVLAGVQEVHPEIMLSSVNNSMVPLKEVLGDMVEHFPRQPSESQCSDREWCASELYTKKNRLFLSLLGLYNMATAQNGSGIIMKSFMRRVEQSMPSIDCAFSTTTPKAFRGSLTLRDRHDLSSTQINRNWRSGVTELFMQNAQTSHDSMMRKIEDTCSDLERRCYDVEGPLRAAEEERDIYASENEQLKRQNKELNEQLSTNNTEVQTKLQNSHECFVELDHEKTRLEQLLQGQYAYTEELTVSLGSTREDLQQQQRSSEKALLDEKEKARSKELEMMATLTGKDDQLEELQEEMCSLQMKNEQTCLNLDQVTSEKAKLSELCSSLEQELANATEALKQIRILADEREDEVNRLLAQEEELRKELGSVETTQNVEVERLYSTLEESEEKSRSEIERLKHDREAEASRAASEIAKHETDSRRLHAAMQAAALDASRDAQSKDKRIQHLERKVQALRDERAAKAREFSEAQQHIGRLMGVMGFSANTPESNAPPRHQRTRSAANTTPAARIPQPVSDDEDGTQLAQSFESITSNSHEPTPKRPRGNRKSTTLPYNLDTPCAAAPKAKSPPPASGMSRSVRKPLAEADRNSPTKSQSSSALKRNQVDDSFRETQAQENTEENRLHDLDLDMDLEFSRDFLFSSTAFTGSTDQIAPQ